MEFFTHPDFCTGTILLASLKSICLSKICLIVAMALPTLWVRLVCLDDIYPRITEQSNAIKLCFIKFEASSAIISLSSNTLVYVR